jgi:hypothetical protein
MKKTYEYVDFSVTTNLAPITSVTSTVKLIDIERDQKNVGIEVYLTCSYIYIYIYKHYHYNRCSL